MPERPSGVLTEDFLNKVKEKLVVNPYTDEQLNRAAFFMVAPVLYNAGEIGAADVSTQAILITANLYAAALLADFINAGCISVSAIDRYMEKAGQDLKEGKIRNVTGVEGDAPDEGIESSDAVQAGRSQEERPLAN